MNKKLFILPVCLIMSLCFTTCEKEYEQVNGLWEQLRNTVWTANVENQEIRIGFYGPRNGPFKDISQIGNSPYVALKDGNHLPSCYEGLEFDRTGNEIRFPDYTDTDGKKHKRSSKISVSGNKLTIKFIRDWWALPSGTYTKVSSDPNYNWNN